MDRVDSIYAGCFMYADDILASCASEMLSMLRVCLKFGKYSNSVFNVKK
jgi:hypothetical protein